MFTSVVVVDSLFFLYDTNAAYKCVAFMERSTMEAISPVVQRLIRNAMVHQTRWQIAELFASANDRRLPEAMYLLDDEKLAVNTDDFASNRPPRRFALPKLDPESRLIMDFPLRSGPSCVQCHGPSKPVMGYIRLISPHADKARAITEQFKVHFMGLLMATLLLGFWALWVVERMVQRPLAKIADAMTKVRSGHLDTRICPEPKGEFGHISAGFNAMLEELETDRSRILDLHRRQVAHMERLAAAGEVAAHLAHEIRNPLTGISSAIQVLKAEPRQDPARGQVLDKILAQLARMDQTMGNFLRFARMPEAKVQPFEIAEALQHTLFLIESRLKSQRIELRSDIQPAIPSLTGDPAQIEQALLNLFLNAVQAMPSGGRLAVRAHRQDSEVRVHISDNGCGIPAGHLERVFQPFFTTRENGSGLGLPLSRQIVLAHGGDLWIESVPDEGTTAHIRLPIPGTGS